MADYFLETQHHEWILTNKYGSYALGTGNLINQRKYHGLLIASDERLNRVSLVTSIQESIEWRGAKLFLDSSNYNNCIYPEGFLHLVKSWLRPYPTFLYSSFPHNNDILIKKTIKMDYETNTVLVTYSNLSTHDIHLRLRPKLDMVNHHYLNSPGTLSKDDFEVNVSEENNRYSASVHRKSNKASLYCTISQGKMKHDYKSFDSVFYPWESMLGYDCNEDLASPFRISLQLEKQKSLKVLFSDSPIKKPSQVIERIGRRYSSLPRPFDYPKITDKYLLNKLDFNDKKLYHDEDYLKILEFSLMDFVTEKNIIAGYPWFGQWGRDSMMVLGCMIKTPHLIDKAETIIDRYSANIRKGLIPNMFPESGSNGNYNSVDTSLYYILLLAKLSSKRDQEKSWTESFSITKEILAQYLKDDNEMFYIAEDGLLILRENHGNATWMDVAVDGNLVTPRDGAPVEINFLWYNALKTYLVMQEKVEGTSKKDEYNTTKKIEEVITKLEKSLHKFWFNNTLCDRIKDGKPIDEFRPNAVIAASLKYTVLSNDQLTQVFERAKNELLTDYGLRTLTPHNYKFKRTYYGTISERDKSYHQGTVWAWLLSPYVSLYLKLYREELDNDSLIYGLEKIIGKFRKEYKHGHIASVASVWDGGNPHFPKGSPAQAWSVAAIYDIENYIQVLKGGKQ